MAKFQLTSIDIRSEGAENLAIAIRLAWDQCSVQKATHYRVQKLSVDRKYGWTRFVPDAEHGTPTLHLLWHEEESAIALPYPMAMDEAAPFAAGWVAQADYGPSPDTDGSAHRGWRAFNGHVSPTAIVSIQPEWIVYSK